MISQFNSGSTSDSSIRLFFGSLTGSIFKTRLIKQKKADLKYAWMHLEWLFGR